MSDELAYAPIAELAPRLAARELSPVELTEAVLARIERLEPRLNAFIQVTAEPARHAARAAEAAIMAGHHLGPLHGIPIAIKDLYATKGIATTYGSPLFAEWVPDFDAAAVERLKRAGAVLVGKTNLHELAYGTTSANAHYGPVNNPWRHGHHPGGSSGGSAAAVAAGMAHGRDGQRHRRLDPPARRLHRHRRHQADLRPGLEARRAAALLVAGPRRPADPHRGGRGAAAAGAGRPRPARPDQRAAPGAGLLGRHRRRRRRPPPGRATRVLLRRM